MSVSRVLRYSSGLILRVNGIYHCDDYAIPPQLRIYGTTMADALLFSLRLIPENGIEEE